MMSRIFDKLDLKRKVMVLRILIIVAYAIIITSGTYAYMYMDGVANNVITGQGECSEGILYEGTEIYHTNLSVTDNYLEGAKGSVSLAKNSQCKIYKTATIYLHTDSFSISGTDDIIMNYKVMNGSTVVGEGRFVPNTNYNKVLAQVELTNNEIEYTIYLWVQHVDGLEDRYFDEAIFSGSFFAESSLSSTIDNYVGYDGLSLGDYISYTPNITSYTTDTSYTGGTITRTINPSELNLWRVIKVNDDGTVEAISQYVSSASVAFSGQTGYQNSVGYLNVLASQYENGTYTVGSRCFGYSNQTEYITDTSYFTYPAPWSCSTGGTCSPDPDDYELYGGGDAGYLDDYNLVNTVLGTRVANQVGTSTATKYWCATRSYFNTVTYDDSYGWNVRVVYASGAANPVSLYYFDGISFVAGNRSFSFRPIVIFKSTLRYSGAGTEASPRVIVN